MSGKLHLICMKTEGFHAKIRCNLNDISYLSETQKNNFQFLDECSRQKTQNREEHHFHVAAFIHTVYPTGVSVGPGSPFLV